MRDDGNDIRHHMGLAEALGHPAEPSKEPGRRNDESFSLNESSSLTEEGGGAGARRETLILSEVMEQFFPQLDELLDPSQSRRLPSCSRERYYGDPRPEHDLYPLQHQFKNEKTSRVMKMMWPGCFERVRTAAELNDIFRKSIKEYYFVKSTSDGEHFQTVDGRFYMYAASEEAVKLLEGDTFIFKYMEYISKETSTLIPQIFAAITFEEFGQVAGVLWRTVTEKKVLLIVENVEHNFVDTSKDSFLEFHLKGSSTRSSRCSPTFPLGFWRDRKAHRLEGQDLDFYALRTQVSRSWYAAKEALLKASNSEHFEKRILQDYVENAPVSENCLGGFAGQEWLEERGADEKSNFCKDLGSSVQNLFEDYAHWQVTLPDANELHEAWNKVASITCPRFANGVEIDDGDQQREWKEFVRQEKVAFDKMREFFGYPARNDELTQKPLVIAPCMREALLEQLRKDTDFLATHGFTDYSMGLIIKYDPEQPRGLDPKANDVDTCNVMEEAEQRLGDYESQGRSIFERYRRGIRAKRANRSDTAENAVFKFKITSLAAGPDSGTMLATSEVNSRLPEVWKDMMSDPPEGEKVGKCKSLENKETNQHTLCWSGCESVSPKAHMGPHACDEFHDKLKNSKDIFVKIAEYDFEADWMEDIGSKDALRCNGWSNWKYRGHNTFRRALCVATNQHHKDVGLVRWPGELTAIPEPFRSEMDDDTIQDIFSYEDLHKDRNDVNTYLNFKVHHKDAPVWLKRIAVMAYYDFARRTLQTDQLSVQEYADRLNSFVSAWVQTPMDKEWEWMCPDAHKAGCSDIGGRAWQADDPALNRKPTKAVFQPYDDEAAADEKKGRNSSGHQASVAVGAAMLALWPFAA